MGSHSDLLWRARAHANAGRHESSRQLLLRELERDLDESRRARVEATLAYVESELRGLGAGLALCDLALQRATGNPQLTGVILGQRALVHMRGGNSAPALADFEAAISLIADEPEALGLAHLNRGNVHLQLGRLGTAQDDFVVAEACFSRAGADVLSAKAAANVGYTKLLGGDIIGSLTSMSVAANVLAPLSIVNRAIAEQDRAEALVAAGMVTEGAKALSDAASAFGARRLRQSQAEAEYLLAKTLMLDKPRRAAAVARRASARFRRRGSESWALRSDAIVLGSEIERGSKNRELIVRATELAARLREEGLAHEALPLELQAARMSLRNDDAVSAAVRSRRLRISPRSPITTRLLAHEVRSELAAAQGRRTQALRQTRDGLADLHAWQSSFGSLDLQSSLVGHGRRLAFQGITLALADGRPKTVFEWSERARALVSRVTPVRPPVDSEAARDLADLRQVHSQMPADLAPARVRREAELRDRIRQRAWYDEGSGNVTEPAALSEVREQLSLDDAALVAYLFSERRLHALVITGDRESVLDLGPFASVRGLLGGMQADLDMTAASLPPVMRTAVQAGLQDRLTVLAAHLVGPISELIGDRRLVITPSGALAGTPWTMLPGFAGRPITVPRSASMWLARRQTAVRLDSAGFAAGPRVARAEEEVVKASSAWSRSTVLVGDAATTTGVRELAGTVDVLHVSAHGRHSAENPLFSGLELTDGPWFGYDIDQLDHIPSTIVLSACELGRSSVRWGEETIGMTAAWLHAGARCVIASPASVDDDVACEVLSRAHELMAAGQAPADALATASADLAGLAQSSFVCFGTGW